MFFSVIIPTRNRAGYLANALQSLTRQTYSLEQFEVIVVDNGSTDNTREICSYFANRIPQLRYLYEESPGLHAARHRGMKTSKSEILVYGDDDIEAFPTWLEGIAEAFGDERIVLAGGKNLPKFERQPPAWILRMWGKDRRLNRILPYLSLLDLGDEVKGVSPYYVFGCNFSIRKSVLLEAGGFHPDAMPRDSIRYRGDGETHVARFIVEKGYQALYHPKASVHHLVPAERLSESHFLERAFTQGISDSYTAIRRKKNTSIWRLRYFKSLGRLILVLKVFRQVRLRAGYLKGFCYHQDEVTRDPGLYDWVTRETYIV